MEMNPGLVNLALSAEGVYKTSSIIYIRFNILCMDIFVYVFPSHGNLLCWVVLRHRPTGCVDMLTELSDDDDEGGNTSQDLCTDVLKEKKKERKKTGCNCESQTG